MYTKFIQNPDDDSVGLKVTYTVVLEGNVIVYLLTKETTIGYNHKVYLFK